MIINYGCHHILQHWKRCFASHNTNTFRKDVRLPIHLQRAMATEAEAAREARAKVRKNLMRRLFLGEEKWETLSQVIAAEGEQKASSALREAAEVIQQSPHALQVYTGAGKLKNEAKPFHPFLFSSGIYRLSTRYQLNTTQLSSSRCQWLFPVWLKMMKQYNKYVWSVGEDGRNVMLTFHDTFSIGFT